MNTEHAVYADLKSLIRLEHKASGFSFLPRQPVQSLLSGRHTSRLRGRGLNFEELRYYRPGDDIRNMDWKVTRRLRKPHIRVYTEERERSILLVVDQRLPMFFGSRRAMKSVVAAELAALAGWRGLGSGDRVGAIIFGEEQTVAIKPQRNRPGFIKVLQQLVAINSTLRVGKKANPGRLNQVLGRVCQSVGHDSLICLISDLNGADGQTERLLSRLAQHNDVILGLVYDALENHLPHGGKLVVTDGELQLEVNTDDHNLRQRFEAEFDQRLIRARQFLLKRGIPVLPINTETEVSSQLREILSAPERGNDVLARLSPVPPA